MKTLQKVLVIAVLFSAQLGASELPVVTLDQAIQSARENNITLETARIRLNQTLRNQDAVISTFMPSLSLTGGVSTGASLPGTATTSGTLQNAVYDGVTLSAGATASFTFSGSMINDSTRRRLAKEEASLAYSQSADSIESSIISAYWILASYEAQLQTTQSSLADAENQLASVTEMYQNGIADELTLAQTELAASQAELQVNMAKNNLELAKASLRSLTGIEGDFTVEELPESVMLSLPAEYELFADYAESTHAIKSARNALEIAKNNKDTQVYSTYVPSLAASVSYSYRGGFDGSTWNYRNTSNGLTGSVTVSVPVSAMLPGSTQSLAIKSAEDSIAIASLALQNEQNTLLSSIRENVTNINQYQQNIAITATTADTANRTYQLAEEAFNAGLMNANDLAAARTNMLTAELNHMVSRLNQLLASYSLAYNLGITLDELQSSYAVQN